MTDTYPIPRLSYLKEARERFDHWYLSEQIKGRTITATAIFIEVPRQSLHRLLKRHGLSVEPGSMLSLPHKPSDQGRRALTEEEQKTSRP